MTRPDLVKDIYRAQWILDKLQNDVYAQNLYAAFCNMQWQKSEVMPILKDELWSVSWRTSGGIIADFRNRGEDYMDWYCSGMADDDAYVAEGFVTDEIKEDLKKLGWHPVPWDDRDSI